MTPSLRFNNLLEELAEFRATLYLLLPIYYKEHNLGTVKWKRYIRQDMGKVCRALIFSPGRPLSKDLDVLTTLKALQTPS